MAHGMLRAAHGEVPENVVNAEVLEQLLFREKLAGFEGILKSQPGSSDTITPSLDSRMCRPKNTCSLYACLLQACVESRFNPSNLRSDEVFQPMRVHLFAAGAGRRGFAAGRG